MEKEKKEILKKALIGITISLIVSIVIVVSIIIFFINTNNNPDNTIENISHEENNTIIENAGDENINIEEEPRDYEILDDAINYIEIEMPNLVGKGYMDILYRYNLKENILNQLYEKDIEGTTFNLNTLKYIGDGSIFINGSYVIEGYGYEVEKQTPQAGSKIKLFNDGEGNVSLGENIHLYIKGGGRTETIDIDPDKRKGESSSNTSESSSDLNTPNNNSLNYKSDAELKVLAFKKWLEQDEYISLQYNYGNNPSCFYTGNITKNADGSVSVHLKLYPDKKLYEDAIKYTGSTDGVGTLGSATIKLTKVEATR